MADDGAELQFQPHIVITRDCERMFCDSNIDRCFTALREPLEDPSILQISYLLGARCELGVFDV